ncbi:MULTISPECIES: 8-oxo-dGTP diphosphatase MutT [Henriciella]|jgi:8-oxo-dGTP diphosphatase|uniref:8-oxo-dGTP diphosphatase n=1 Tax=Henriciella pelagia TaxID=1977912 RepID=A0ABQ1JRT3_9PROT|nr:8-oxo-dGTP diphosphatase MutT [Henriciella pelagia]GGB73009.1 NTP pyrophosphohydrolase [Henriciella pelagia]
MTKKLLLVSAAAIFDGEGRILLAQRPPGKAMAGLWEFPGGKVEPGETPAIALARELKEELQIAVDPENLEPINFASFDYPDFHLLMPLFAVSDWDGEPVALEGQTLEWVKPADLDKYPAPPADIPLFADLAARF